MIWLQFDKTSMVFEEFSQEGKGNVGKRLIIYLRER